MAPPNYVPTSKASRLFPGKPHPLTILRWRLTGLIGPDGNRVKLRYIRSGKRIFTTREWADEFLAALNAEPSQSGAVECELTKAGI